VGVTFVRFDDFADPANVGSRFSHGFGLREIGAVVATLSSAFGKHESEWRNQAERRGMFRKVRGSAAAGMVVTQEKASAANGRATFFITNRLY
jgi:hypothetical protein